MYISKLVYNGIRSQEQETWGNLDSNTMSRRAREQNIIRHYRQLETLWARGEDTVGEGGFTFRVGRAAGRATDISRPDNPSP